MIEGNILRYVAGEPETIVLTVLEPEGTFAGQPYHLITHQFWANAQPWARDLFARWGFARLPAEHQDRVVPDFPGLIPHGAAAWAAPDVWPEGTVELDGATATFAGKLATVVVARTSEE